MHFPGEGTRQCKGTTEQGTRCAEHEIEGLEFCLRHVPDDLLDEAEETTGMRRCRENFGVPLACRRVAIQASNPPACDKHGQQPGTVARRISTNTVIQGKMADRLAMILREGGEKLLNPPNLADPLTELVALAAEMKAGKELLRDVTAYLYSNNQMRYQHNKAGEMARMEILLYERAQERFAKILLDISKLRIDERLMGIRQQTADMMERALDAALEESGVGIEGKGKAREALRRHLKVVA